MEKEIKISKSFFSSNILPEVEFNIDEIENILNNTDSKQQVPGVQKKLSLHLSNHRNNHRLTLFDEPKGYILKFEKDSSLMAIDEYVTMSLARIAKIKTVDFTLIKLSNGQYGYITKRFDRIDNKKIHVEDFCQLTNKLTEQKYSGSYEFIGKTLKKFSTSANHGSVIELAQFFNIVLFSYVVGNSDMHLKNFSLIEDKTIYFSPAYDLINVHLLINDPDDLAIPLNGKTRKLTKNDFISFGLNIGLAINTINKLFS